MYLVFIMDCMDYMDLNVCGPSFTCIWFKKLSFETAYCILVFDKYEWLKTCKCSLISIW